MPRNLKRYYGRGDEHFVTFSCYRRLPLLVRRERLETTRKNYEMVVTGYVVMPEHVHLLVEEPRKQNLSVALKALKQAVSRRVFETAAAEAGHGALFAGGVRLDHFWQARFHDFNVWSPKKHLEKLRYIHRNLVTRGLVTRPELWRWSNFRHYAYGEAGLVGVNERMASDRPLWKRSRQGVESHTRQTAHVLLKQPTC